MYNVCSCASSSAISQAQSLKLFSKKTKIKGETSTSLSFSLFSRLLIFLILHLFLCLHSLLHPYLSLSFFFLSRPSIFQPLPPYTSLQMSAITVLQPMATAKRGGEEDRETEIDRRASQRVCVQEFYCMCWYWANGLIWSAHCSPLTPVASQHQGVSLQPTTTSGLRDRHHTPHCGPGFNEGHASLCMCMCVCHT